MMIEIMYFVVFCLALHMVGGWIEDIETALRRRKDRKWRNQ